MANYLITTNDFQGAGVPAGADDHVIVPATNQQSVSVNLDNNGVDLLSMVVSRGYMGNVGSSGSPLLICCKRLHHFGGGDLYFTCHDGNTAGYDCDEVLISCMSASNKVVLDTTGAAHQDSDFQDIRIFRGQLEIASTIEFHASARIEVGYVSNKIGDASVVLPASTPTLPTLIMNGGQVKADSVITYAAVAGGVLRVDTATPVTVDVFDGGRFVLNHTAATTVRIFDGGVLDLTEIEDFKTITTLLLHPRAKLIAHGEPNADGGPTVTNLTDLRDSNA